MFLYIEKKTMIVIKTFYLNELNNITESPCIYGVFYIYLKHWILQKVQYKLSPYGGESLGRLQHLRKTIQHWFGVSNAMAIALNFRSMLTFHIKNFLLIIFCLIVPL